MKITITRKDWKKGINYGNSCGCLLAVAARRKLRRWVFVSPGYVDAGHRVYCYNPQGIESRLKLAHTRPSLLPITIELK